MIKLYGTWNPSTSRTEYRTENGVLVAHGRWDRLTGKTLLEMVSINADRGGVEDPDFALTDLTADDDWHELDFSSIVPEPYSWIQLACEAEGPLKKTVYFRGVTRPAQGKIRGLTIQAAATLLHKWFWLYCGRERKIEYAIDSGNWTTINLYVLGWNL